MSGGSGVADIRKRKLIEVSLPLEAINRESAREKSIRHGHPSTLHLWWARRPLAACRAVLFAQLVDDPSSNPRLSEEEQILERKKLHSLIEELVIWENSNNEDVLRRAREKILESCDGNPPPILDPFAGGGSIPLEAQRLGLEAHASDLNPVAVLINKALIEIPPKWTGHPPVFPGAAESRLGNWPGNTGLAEDVRRYGQWMRDEAEKRIGHLYPKAKLPDGTEATVIAWIWARTVRCPNPACRIQMPLVRSWWLSKRKGKETYVVPSIVDGKVSFSIAHNIEGAPTPENDGTVRRTRAICIGCEEPVALSYVRAEGRAKRLGVELMAIVAEAKRRRVYLPPDTEHAKAANISRPVGAPDTDLPEKGLGFRVQAYGLVKHADLFTNRQLATLLLYCTLIEDVREQVVAHSLARSEPDAMLQSREESAISYGEAVALYLCLSVTRTADVSNCLSTWSASRDQVRNLFSRQAVPMSWDFAEVSPFAGAAGDLETSVETACRALLRLPSEGRPSVRQGPAGGRGRLSSGTVSTDPPYYDNVGYADLSDFFYIWLRVGIGRSHGRVLGTVLTPKEEELVADPARHGGRLQAERFFREGFERVFENIRSSVIPEYPISVYYAFKQAEVGEEGRVSTGWENLLEGMIRSGWVITGTWPINTERGGRMRDIGSNALASSVVLSCRLRGETAGRTDRRGFISKLRGELPAALKELQQGNIAPVDLAQAAIGPGMAVFSGYSQVTEPDGSPMRVRTALMLINQVLAEVLTEQEGEFDSDSRFALKWFEQYGWDEGDYDDAEKLVKAYNTSVKYLERAGIFWARAGKARLIAPDELPDNFGLSKGVRVTVWEAVLHLVKRLDTQGIDAAARFMAEAGEHLGDLDTVKELAYLLYAICERKKWAKQALRFNNLVSTWSDLGNAARSVPVIRREQGVFDFESISD